MTSTGNVPRTEIKIGQRIGRGVVLRFMRVQVGPRMLRGAELRCDCGALYSKPLGRLRGGGSRSCGCLRRERGQVNPVMTRSTHGLADHSLYPVWAAMMGRCHDPDHPRYPDYGGRGIEVCEPWHDVAVFVADIERELGPRPGGRRPSGRPEYTLDRADNSLGYAHGNMRWATWHQQRINRRPVTAS